MYIYIGEEMKLHENFNLPAPYEKTDITAPFFIFVDENEFPNSEWIDYPYPVLCNWAETLLDHKNSLNARYDLYFYDRQYQLNVFQNNDKVLCISFTNGRRENDRIYTSIRVSYDSLLSEICRSLIELRSMLYLNGANDNPAFDRVMTRVKKCIHDCNLALKNKEFNDLNY